MDLRYAIYHFRNAEQPIGFRFLSVRFCHIASKILVDTTPRMCFNFYDFNIMLHVTFKRKNCDTLIRAVACRQENRLAAK